MTHNMSKTRRAHDRQTVLVEAELSSARGACPCKILNISAGGAQLQVEHQLKTGGNLELVIKPFGSYGCKCVWQNGEDLGIEFLEDFQVMAEVVLALAVYG